MKDKKINSFIAIVIIFFILLILIVNVTHIDIFRSYLEKNNLSKPPQKSIEVMEHKSQKDTSIEELRGLQY